jgi:hypothetical protein
MFTCDVCGSNVHGKRPIMRACGVHYRLDSGSYAHVLQVERLCEGCDEAMNEAAIEDIELAFMSDMRN